MAASTAITVAYGASSLLPLPSAFAISSRRFSSFSPEKILDLSYLRRRANAPSPSPRRAVVRAAKTESREVKLGARAPDFELPEPLTGNLWKLDDFELYPCLLVMFICNHCPFVIHLKKDIVKLSNFYMKDGPEFMARCKKVQVPISLYDESQEVAREFGAVCTPEFFLYKKDGRRPYELVYHGQFDDSRPSNNIPVNGRDLSLAIDLALSCQPIPSNQKPSVGCSIKWHPGAES